MIIIINTIIIIIIIIIMMVSITASKNLNLVMLHIKNPLKLHERYLCNGDKLVNTEFLV